MRLHSRIRPCSQPLSSPAGVTRRGSARIGSAHSWQARAEFGSEIPGSAPENTAGRSLPRCGTALRSRHADAGPSLAKHLGASGFSAFTLLCVFLLASSAVAQPRAIFLVRHAERAATSGRVPSDTGISAQGKTRAEHLAQELKDAGIRAIFTTEYKRTQQTAAPLAQLLGIQPEAVSAGDLRSLIAKIKNTTGNLLVVGHSNTLPQIINALGVHTRVIIPESEYDNLFIVLADRAPQIIHLHYR